MTAMKNTYIFFLMLCFTIASVQPAQAQFWKKVKDRVTNRAENRALNEVDKATDDAIDDALEGSPEESSDDEKPTNDNDTSDDEEEMDQQQANEWMAKMLGGSSVALPDQYEFDYVVDYTSTADGKTQNMSYMMGSGEVWGFKVHDEKEPMMMVIDGERDIMAMYSERKGKKQVQKLPSMMSSQFVADAIDNSEEVPDDYSIEKTGKTKNIAGYHCEEYAISSPDGSGFVWIAPDLEANFMQAFSRTMKKSKKMKNMAKLFEFMSGTMLESTYTDKKGDTNHMIATKVNTSPDPIDHSEYEEVGLGG